ncbi:MAG: flavodoxin family protein [Syntrophales bacterium]|jgi:multimeric flavodoxin WrbA|nr:flavodoxin family protein [Syntrophales bacterium]
MANNIKLLGIYGSPRKGGNTDALLAEALKGAKAAGARVESLRVSDFKITPCRGCHDCSREGICKINDDMQEIYPRLLDADIVILASPIYFYGVTGWTKALIDRSQALWERKYTLQDPALGEQAQRKKGFFISVGGTKGQKLFEGASLTVKYFFDAFNASYTGDLLFRKVDANGDIHKYPEALPQAFAAGQKLVADLASEK